MNHLPGSVRQIIAAVRGWIIFTVICGIAYPLVVYGIGQIAFSHHANGSLVSYKGRIVGSSLLCQEFVNAKGSPLPQYFQSRPSDATSGAASDYGCDPVYSAASNLGPDNPKLVALVKQRQKEIELLDHVPVSLIPSNAVTASGSGLDPDISPQNAAIQVDRVAAARHTTPAAIRALVAKYTSSRIIGFLGQPVVNVLLLNIALDQRYPLP
ncbi:MAG TPA: potassium-transporting ATPase subunit KdpC [Streptosporangiaceae bacterium]|nr:potassium-transporting ATPase subunit KdpC [Streptosporangiaceae bacterium]